jgi:translation elongation factor EF-Ts
MQKLGDLVDEYIAARSFRLDLERQAVLKKTEEEYLKAKLFKRFAKEKTEVASGSLGYVQYHKKDKPKIVDWRKFCDYVVKHDAFDLFHKRVTESAWEARLEDGEKVPGIETYPYETLSVGGNK